MAPVGFSPQVPAVPHGSGAVASSNNIRRCRQISFCPRNPGGINQLDCFKDDVRDYAQEFDLWYTLTTPATTLAEIQKLNPQISSEEQQSKYDTIHTKWQSDSNLLYSYMKPCLTFVNDEYNEQDLEHIREHFTSQETSARDGPGLYHWILSFSDPTKHSTQMSLKRDVFDFAIPINTDLKNFRLSLNALVRTFAKIVGNSLSNRSHVYELYSHILGSTLENGTRTGLPISPINHPLVLVRLRLNTYLKNYVPTSTPPFQCNECADIKGMIENLCLYAEEAGLVSNPSSKPITESPAVFGIGNNTPPPPSSGVKLTNNCNSCDASCCRGNVKGGGMKNCCCSPANSTMELPKEATRGQKDHVGFVRAYWKQNSHLTTMKNMSMTISRISREEADKRKAAQGTPKKDAAGAERSVNATIRVDAMDGFVKDAGGSLSSDESINEWLNNLGAAPGVHMNIRTGTASEINNSSDDTIEISAATREPENSMEQSENDMLRLAMQQMLVEQEATAARVVAAESALCAAQQQLVLPAYQL